MQNRGDNVDGPGISVENRTLGPALVPGLLAGLFLLSPGAPVNNCRWASIQWTWDQLRGDRGKPTERLLVQLGWAVHWASTLKLQARKEFVARNGSESIQVLVNHWRWLEANGYKQQAASCKRQAASLTRKYYNDIQDIKGERKNENKRST